jgi:hypothetical protein
LAAQSDELTLDLKLLGFTGAVTIRNLWERRNLGRFQETFSIAVPAHGAQLVQVKP